MQHDVDNQSALRVAFPGRYIIKSNFSRVHFTRGQINSMAEARINDTRKGCGNYRGISLLSAVGNVFAEVVLQRLHWLAECIYPQSVKVEVP